MKRGAFLLALLCAISIIGAGATVVRITNITAGSSAVDIEAFSGIVQWVEDYINASGQLDEEIELEFVASDSYEAVILAMKYGDVQIARFGPESYTIAHEQAGAVPIAREIRTNTGLPHYFGIIITRNDSDIWGLCACQDWSGYKLGFVTETSTSGYKVPMAVFRAIGMSPEDFEEVYYAGSHEAVIVATLNGHVDVGCTTYNRYDEALAAGLFKLNDLRVIYTSDAIPSSLIARAGDFDLIPHDLLVEAFEAVPEDVALAYNVLGFSETEDRDYDPIRALDAE